MRWEITKKIAIHFFLLEDGALYVESTFTFYITLMHLKIVGSICSIGVCVSEKDNPPSYKNDEPKCNKAHRNEEMK